MSQESSEAKKRFITDFIDMQCPTVSMPVSIWGLDLIITLDTKTDMLYAGRSGNRDSYREFGVAIDYDFSLDQNLEELYEEIISKIMV